MELRAYATVLWRRKWVLVVTTLLVTAIAAIGSYRLLTPKYVASATLWVPTTGQAGANTGDILLADRLMNTYAALATSRPVLQELERTLGVPPTEVKEAVDVGFEPQTELLTIAVMSSNPEQAADIATNLAEILISQTQRTKAGRDQRVSLFAPAGVPEIPSWLGFFPTPYWREINIGLAFLVSLIVGVGLAFLFEYLDTTLYTNEQIEAVTELATLGTIPTARRRQQMAALNGSTLHGEAFRYLRTSIYMDQQKLPQTLLITSAMPGEGKSTIVANLATAVAQSGQTIIIVDADLRLPAIHKIFNVSIETGLTSILKGEATVSETLQNSHIPGVQIITSGPLSPHPAELLDSPQMLSLINELSQRSDLILFDSPSLLAVSDAAVLAPSVDGVVLVVSRAQAQQETVRAARHRLATIGAKLVGIVVNRADEDDNYYYHYASSHVNGEKTA